MRRQMFVEFVHADVGAADPAESRLVENLPPGKVVGKQVSALVEGDIVYRTAPSSTVQPSVEAAAAEAVTARRKNRLFQAR